MAGDGRQSEDVRVEHRMGNLLRVGVVLAALVTAVGAMLYLAERWAEHRPPYEKFPLPLGHHPDGLNSVAGVVRLIIAEGLGRGLGRGLIQLGVLLLIATPVARVAFSVYVFGRQRDRLYVIVTVLVLALLLFSLFSGGWLPG